MHFKNYPAERLVTPAIASRLADDEWRLRQRILSGIITQGKPLPFEEFAMEPADRQRLSSLVAKRAVVCNEAGAVTFAYPVSALPTQHRVTLADGRTFRAMCAIDAMGAAFTFCQDVEVESWCTKCAEPVTVSIRSGKLARFTPPGLHVLHVDLNRNDNWSGSC
jgi:hypothetical protein